jgi:hypothetical protein
LVTIAAGGLAMLHAADAALAANSSVCVVAQDGCYVPGSLVRATLELGSGDTVINAGQFVIEYDPDALEFVSIFPGAACDASSPFSIEFYESVDEIAGSITYAVGIDPWSEPGTSGPASMACLAFMMVERVDSEVCLSDDPASSFLSDADGAQVPIDNSQDCPTSCDEVESSHTCFCDAGGPDCSAWDNDCNVGECIVAGAVCEPVPTNEGGPCDDGDPCTTVDTCVNGICRGTGCDHQSLCVVADVGCYAYPGVQVRVELGAGEPYIVAGEFTLMYDPGALDFVSIAPGATCDPESPFALEVYKEIDQVNGAVYYAAGVDFMIPDSATQGPATLACVTFGWNGGSESEVCLMGGTNPISTVLASATGQPITVYNSEDCPPDVPPPVLACETVIVDEDCTCVAGTADCSALDSQCAVGVCNELTGRCEMDPINEFGPCDDGNPCTTPDRCMLGQCVGFNCDDPSLCVVEEICVGPGFTNELTIQLGESDNTIVGGQFSILYDPALVDLVSISPGAACDPSSPFGTEIFKQVDEEAGEIFYAVGVDFLAGQGGTKGPAAMACLTVIAETSRAGEICLFKDMNPYSTLLVDEFGQSVGIYNDHACPTDHPLPIISCAEVCTIPTLSTWGLLILGLLLLVTAKLYFGRAAQATAA